MKIYYSFLKYLCDIIFFFKCLYGNLIDNIMILIKCGSINVICRYY